MKVRAGAVALVTAALLGPLAMVLGVVLVPEGCSYPELRTGSVPVNLLFLSTDRLGVDRLRSGPSDDAPVRDEYPALARLANHGISVLRAFAASDRSPAAEASFVFSLLPTSHDVVDWDRRATPRLPTLFQAFAARGYATAAFANLPLLWSTGLARGADFSLELDTDDPADQVFAAEDWVRTTGGAHFVAWIHHAAPPGQDPAEILDRLVGETVAALKAQRRYEETCIVAFSTTAPGRAEFEVPLIIRLPIDDITDAVRRGPVSLLDIYPTMAKMLRVPIHKNPHVGRSLLDPPHKPLFSGHHFHGLAPFEWVEPGRLRVGIAAQNLVVVDGDPEPEMFDRLRDPEGENPRRLGEQPEEVGRALLTYLESARKLCYPGVGATVVPLAEAARLRLERLGRLDPKEPDAAVPHRPDCENR